MKNPFKKGDLAEMKTSARKTFPEHKKRGVVSRISNVHFVTVNDYGWHHSHWRKVSTPKSKRKK